ncbi:EF-P 5-aminopentanol modification-associated protein YfmF [Natranaerobius trueperi]|nr:pitrilysin family protein [Natranaerobius trueperi]
MEVITKELAQDVRLHMIPQDNLKTTLIKVFFHWPLGNFNGHMGIVPRVLKRGTKDYPTFLEFNEKLEEMYGADFVTGLHKKGERQLIELRLEMVGEDFLLEQDRQKSSFNEGINLLSKVLFEPVLEEDGFATSTVEKEKQNQLDRISNQKDDKINYSVERMIKHMCQDEPFGESKFGNEKEIEKITGKSLYESYKRLLESAPIDIFVMGHFSKSVAEKAVTDKLKFSNRKDTPDFNVQVNKELFEEKEINEYQDVNQGKLCLGFRTQINYKQPKIYPLMLFNGLLGGFSHSRLFRVVREEHSLCYYVFSRLEKSKGIMVINAGIDPKDYDQTNSLIKTELENLKNGDFTDKELEMTRKAILSALIQLEDNPDAIAETLLEGIINGKKPVTPEEVRNKLQAVDSTEITKAGKNVHLDTIYLMAKTSNEKVGVT